ncbi:MAG: hypothetical protein V4813_06525 [Gemmatimonadota bacterium]
MSPVRRKFSPSLHLLVVAVCLAITGTGAGAQPPSTAGADTARARLAPLTWLVGEWEGPVHLTAGGRKMTLTQRETVIEAANGTVLVVRGRGSLADPARGEREVFQAVGLLTYDVSVQRFRWVSSGGSGVIATTEPIVDGSSFVWSTPPRNGTQTRYTITRSAAGEWVEIGEESRDDVTWTRTLEMRLTKK